MMKKVPFKGKDYWIEGDNVYFELLGKMLKVNNENTNYLVKQKFKRQEEKRKRQEERRKGA